MKRFLICAAAIVAVAGCSKTAEGPKQASQQNDLREVASMTAYSLGSPIQSGDLAVVPVVHKSPAPKQGEEYATLAEAMKNDWVEIIEKPGGEVGTLLVRNTGPKPLLLLGGELLVGGKQDRVVCKDVIVPPGKTVPVAVNCVEHGRWTEGERFKSGGMMVPQRVRREANFGTQEMVWDKVAEYNDEAKADAGKTTIQAGLGKADVRKKTTADLAKIVEGLKAREGVVGVIIAYDGKPQTLELFGSSALFDAAKESVLTSALNEVALRSSRGAQVPAMSDFEKFFIDCLNAPRKLRSQDNGVNSFSASTNGLDGAEVATPAYEAKPASKQDGLVHGTYSRSTGR